MPLSPLDKIMVRLRSLALAGQLKVSKELGNQNRTKQTQCSTITDIKIRKLWRVIITRPLNKDGWKNVNYVIIKVKGGVKKSSVGPLFEIGPNEEKSEFIFNQFLVTWPRIDLKISRNFHFSVTYICVCVFVFVCVLTLTFTLWLVSLWTLLFQGFIAISYSS